MSIVREADKSKWTWVLAGMLVCVCLTGSELPPIPCSICAGFRSGYFLRKRYGSRQGLRDVPIQRSL